MTGFLSLSTAMAAFCAIATAGPNNSTGLRLRARDLQGDDQVLYCNSIGCSAGLTAIPNANTIVCDDDPCQESQCCEAFCSYYACPDNYVQVGGAATIECDVSGCTTDLCCLYASDDGGDTVYCNSIGCSAGFTPIADASTTECEDDPCEESQCCEAFCSYYACPENYVQVNNAANIQCEDTGCTTELCCEYGSSRCKSDMCLNCKACCNCE